MLVVGLTGGIGSGKTTVANLFAKLGVPIIDTDQLARDVTTATAPALKIIQEKFGNDVVLSNGELDRKKLRDIVFQDETKRKTLESILHPLIREEIAKQIKQFNAPYCLVIIPLLFETTPNPLIDRVLVVDTMEDLQITRTLQRDKVTEENVRSIIKTQVPREHRLQKADDIIVNDQSLDDLVNQVKNLHQFYLSISD